MGSSQSEAQASAIAIILPLTVISAAVYLGLGYVHIKQSLVYIPYGLIGALIGAYLLPRVPSKYLKKAFGLLMIWAGVRMVYK